MFPSNGSDNSAPPSLPRVPAVRFPCFDGTIRTLRLPAAPSRRASLPSLGGTTPSASYFARSAADAGRGRLLELVTRYLRPDLVEWKRQDLPGSWGTPCALALLSDPGRTGRIRPYGASARPPLCPRRRLPHSIAFEAQSHGFGTRCLRFAGRVTPTPRKTRFRLLARLYRAGLVTRRVPSKGFKVYPTSILLSQVQRSARTSLVLTSWVELW